MNARTWILCALLPLPAFAQQSGRDLALSLRQNVVRIKTEFGQSSENGFGFIVGEKNGTLYAVTADHVVSAKEPDAPAAKVWVETYDDQGNAVEAKLRNHDVAHDLAVIAFPAPDGFHWNPKELSAEEHADQVWFIGQSGNWYVPRDPGHISSDVPTDERIQIEGLPSLRPGTSGGPLIAPSGIVGMVVNDSAEGAQALTIAFIRVSLNRWNHPFTAQVISSAPAKTEVARKEESAPKGDPDPLVAALREQQPNDRARRGFDLGMITAEGQTAWGPGKQSILESLPPAEQEGFKAAAYFLMDRNRYRDRAALGAKIAEGDEVLTLARTKENDARYSLGFDIATAIYGDPSKGAQGNTAVGPGALGIRNSFMCDAAKRGFDAAVKLHLARHY